MVGNLPAGRSNQFIPTAKAPPSTTNREGDAAEDYIEFIECPDRKRQRVGDVTMDLHLRLQAPATQRPMHAP